MRQLNNHIKEVMGIKEQPKPKKDYTKAFVWISVGAITLTIWTIIYNLIF
jgi:hypothetical protein